QRVLLQRDGEHPAPRWKFEAGNRFAVEQDGARRWIEKPHDHRDDGALAGAAGTCDRGDFTDARLEVHIGKHGRARIVAEGHVVEDQRSRGFWWNRTAAAYALLGRLTDHLEHARDRDDYVLH